MRIGVFIIISALMLNGCVHLEANKNISALQQIKAGDAQEVVFQIMGPPDHRKDVTEQRFMVYYQTKAGNPVGELPSAAFFTPIAFESGRVVAVGEDLIDTWTREEGERLRQAEIAEREGREAKIAETARQVADQARQEKITAIEEAVKPVPASNAALNLKLYRQLLDLDPDNPRYQKKVALYEERLVRQEKARQERAVHSAKMKRRQAWEQAREARNKTLRQYSGNGTAQIAVHDMGSGSLYVWVKNVSKQIITTHPDYFTLVDEEKKPIRCEISGSLDSVLEPGSISHGKLEYSREAEPRELIFQNREVGRISKLFQ
ncbi:hypothetical protein [Desulfosarcina sp.]|uniref:hypothetical protein n=1 Tax=Desulfosarcina sp. TaxID=2027861 RepID=UPI003970B768